MKKKILIVAGNLKSGTLVSATSAQCHSSVVIEGGGGGGGSVSLT